MKERKNCLILLLLMATMILSSCGSKTTPAEAENGDKNASTGVVFLRVWGAEEDGQLLQQIIDNFIETYKGQASFNITVEAVAESDCKDRILDDVLSAPDVFTFADDQLATFVQSGVIRPVEYNLADVKDRNMASAVAASSINEVLYSYPLTADNGYFLYYNKKYFKESDLASLDSILEICQANEKKMTIDWSSGWYLYSLFGNTGLTVGLNEDGITNYCTWNSTDNDIKGVDVATAMLSYAANPGLLVGGDSDLTAGAGNDTVVAGVSGVWLSNALTEAWGNNLGAVKLPTYTVAGKQVQMSSYSGYKMLGVNSYSENVAWAEMLADYISNEDNQKLRFEMRGQGPSNTVAASSELVAASPAIQALIAQSAYASLQRIGASYWGPAGEFGALMRDGNPDGLALQDILDSTVSGIIDNN